LTTRPRAVVYASDSVFQMRLEVKTYQVQTTRPQTIVPDGKNMSSGIVVKTVVASFTMAAQMRIFLLLATTVMTTMNVMMSSTMKPTVYGHVTSLLAEETMLRV